MKRSLILIALISGCGASDQSRDSVANGDINASTRAAPAEASASTSLTGLYEGGDSAMPSQLCILEKKGEAAFGLIVRGANLSACGGAGIVERKGETLHLRMTGDQKCRIDATLRDGTIALKGPAPTGCSYYCSAPAHLGGAVLTRKGATFADAMKAKDLAGDPLCSG